MKGGSCWAPPGPRPSAPARSEGRPPRGPPRRLPSSPHPRLRPRPRPFLRPRAPSRRRGSGGQAQRQCSSQGAACFSCPSSTGAWRPGPGRKVPAPSCGRRQTRRPRRTRPAWASWPSAPSRAGPSCGAGARHPTGPHPRPPLAPPGTCDGPPPPRAPYIRILRTPTSPPLVVLVQLVFVVVVVP